MTGGAKRDRGDICRHGKESARYDRTTCLTTVLGVIITLRLDRLKIASPHAMNLIALRTESINQLSLING